MKRIRAGEVSRTIKFRKRIALERLEDRLVRSTITELDLIPRAINNLGHIVGPTGSRFNGVEGDSYFWTSSGGDQDLGLLAWDLNDSDKVVGASLEGDNAGDVYYNPVSWTPKG